MGNKPSFDPQIPQILISEWEQIEVERAQNTFHGDFRTFRHLEIGRLTDEYEMYFTDEQDFKVYLDAFIWRLREPNIVRTFYLKEDHQEQLCSKTYVAQVYIEHINTRLSDITDIPYPENLYVASCAFDGYHKLYDHLHYFRVEESQICVDSEGLVRVWLNSDLSKNYPEISNDEEGDETTMVEQILAILEENTDTQSQPVSLISYFRRNGSRGIGFQQAKIILNDYIRQQNLNLPVCFQSIMQIYLNQNREETEGDLFQRRVQENHPVGKISRASHQPEAASQSIQLNSYVFPQDSQQMHDQNDQMISSAFHHDVQSVQNPNRPYLYSEASRSSRANLVVMPGQQRGFQEEYSHAHSNQFPVHPFEMRTNPRKQVFDPRLQPFNQVLNLQQGTSFSQNPPSFAPSSRQFTPYSYSPQPYHSMSHHGNSAFQRPYSNVNYSPPHSNYKPYSPQPMPTIIINNKMTQQPVPLIAYNGARFNNQEGLISNNFVRNGAIYQPFAQKLAQQPRLPNQRQQQFQPTQSKAEPVRENPFYPRVQSQERILKVSESERDAMGYSYRDKNLNKGEDFEDKMVVTYPSPHHQRVNRFAVEADQQIRETLAQQNQYSRDEENASPTESRRREYNQPIIMLIDSGKDSSKKRMFSSGADRRAFDPVGYHSPGNSSIMRRESLESRPQAGYPFSNSMIKNSNNESHKAYYYTLDTAEELDPEIAADLKKFYSFS